MKCEYLNCRTLATAGQDFCKEHIADRVYTDFEPSKGSYSVEEYNEVGVFALGLVIGHLL